MRGAHGSGNAVATTGTRGSCLLTTANAFAKLAVTCAPGVAGTARAGATGIVVSLVTIGVGVALAAAPIGFGPSYAVPRLWQTPPDRPQVSPPALPGRW